MIFCGGELLEEFCSLYIN